MPALNGLRFCLHTFGCQMNKHDSERVDGMLEALGASAVATPEEADLVIFLTCCVREAADERLYGQVSSLRNLALRPNSTLGRRLIAVGGCIGQRDGEGLMETLPNVDIVFGTRSIASLPSLIEEALTKTTAVDIEAKGEGFSSALPSVREHQWAAWLPITIGCDNFCSYCIVPYVRGRETSRPMEDIVAESEGYVADGVQEITLLGQNVNSYGRDLYGSPQFAEILDAVAATGVPRLRFATSHPKDLTQEVIERFATLPNLMPALHLPAQSGSNTILKAMNRRYTREHYLELVRALREACPDIALSTDIIVGFPGETEEDFLETLSLVDEVGYHQVFTFIYSKREGTPAAAIDDPTPREVIQDRFDRLLKVVERHAYEENQKDLHSCVPVLVEGTSKKNKDILTGKSPKNQTVHFPIPAHRSVDQLLGTIVPVSIEEARTWYLSGRVVE